MGGGGGPPGGGGGPGAQQPLLLLPAHAQHLCGDLGATTGDRVGWGGTWHPGVAALPWGTAPWNE